MGKVSRGSGSVSGTISARPLANLSLARHAQGLRSQA